MMFPDRVGMLFSVVLFFILLPLWWQDAHDGFFYGDGI